MRLLKTQMGSALDLAALLVVLLVVLLVFLLAPLKSSASNDVERYCGNIFYALKEAQKFQKGEGCVFCEPYLSGDDGPVSNDCRNTYRRFYNVDKPLSAETARDKEIEIRVAFGYMDYRNSVTDGYAKAAFIGQMTRPCLSDRKIHACGFVPDSDDADLLTKQILVRDQNGVYRSRVVKLRMRSSSVSNNDQNNRDPRLRDLQARKTAAARDFFLDGLQRSDMVLYVGHSREGGGPDFGPPFKFENGKTDFKRHCQEAGGILSMEAALRAAGRGPKMLGIFSCFSKGHFRSRLKALAPETGLLLTGASNFGATLGQAVVSVDSVLGLKCEDEFTQAARYRHEILDPSSETHTEPMYLDGVFGQQVSGQTQSDHRGNHCPPPVQDSRPKKRGGLFNRPWRQ